MIPAPPWLAARFTSSDPPTLLHRRVVGFDDEDGAALIVGFDHRLVPVTAIGNFDGFDDLAPDPEDYAVMMPPGGWRVEYTDDDGSKQDMPLVGWALRRNGGVAALVTDGDQGSVDDLDLLGGKWRVYHPDARDLPAPGGDDHA